MSLKRLTLLMQNKMAAGAIGALGIMGETPFKFDSELSVSRASTQCSTFYHLL